MPPPARPRVVRHDDGETEQAVEERLRAAVGLGEQVVDLDEHVRLVVGTVMRVRRAAVQQVVEAAAARADAVHNFLEAVRRPTRERGRDER